MPWSWPARSFGKVQGYFEESVQPLLWLHLIKGKQLYVTCKHAMTVTHCQGLLYQVHTQCQGSCKTNDFVIFLKAHLVWTPFYRHLLVISPSVCLSIQHHLFEAYLLSPWPNPAILHPQSAFVERICTDLWTKFLGHRRSADLYVISLSRSHIFSL